MVDGICAFADVDRMADVATDLGVDAIGEFRCRKKKTTAALITTTAAKALKSDILGILF